MKEGLTAHSNAYSLLLCLLIVAFCYFSNHGKYPGSGVAKQNQKMYYSAR